MEAFDCSTLAIKFRCVNIAPFEGPVVPPVYCKKAKSSPFTATGVKLSFAPLAIALLNLTAPGKLYAGTCFLTYFRTQFTTAPLIVLKRSPTLVRITCSTSVLSITVSSTLAKFSRIKIDFAPESFN